MRSYTRIFFTLILSSSPYFFITSSNAENKDHSVQQLMTKPATNDVHTGVGTLTGVDANNGKITLSHGPIKSLNWPAMTMEFSVQNRQLLNNAKVGETVVFELRAWKSGYVLVSLKSQTS